MSVPRWSLKIHVSARLVMRRVLTTVLVAATLPVVASVAMPSATAAPPGRSAAALAAADPFRALVFSKTAGFRHDSIPAGIAAIQAAGRRERLHRRRHRGRGAFTDREPGPVPGRHLPLHHRRRARRREQTAFEDYIRAGGGYAGIHAAADTEYAWPWYGGLVGAYFASHPANQNATVKVEDPAHPSTDGPAGPLVALRRVVQLPDQPPRHRPRPGQPRRDDATRPAPAPWATTTRSPGARTTTAAAPGTPAWATPSSRTPSRQFLAHLLGGIQTAAGVVDADCSATVTEQLREGRAGRQHQQPDGARHRRRRPGVLHRARRPGADRQAGHRHHGHRARPRRVHRQRGRPDRHPARPGLRHQRLGLPLLLAQRRLAAQPCCPGSPSPATPSTWPARSVVLAGRRPSATPAATPAAPWPSTPPATSTCPPATTPTRSSPTGSPRSTSGPGRQDYDAQRTVGQHQRPARQDPADPPAGRRHLHRPGRQPLPARHRADQARDLRDGLPQPVPDRHRPDHRPALRRPTTAPTRGAANPNRGPARARSSGTPSARPATTAGRTATATTTPTTTTTSRPARAGRSSTAPPR